MKKRKLLLAAIALLLVLFIGGTAAYFTDTEEVTNTFTLGNIDITLTEPNFDSNDALGLMPGASVTKDPRVNNIGNAPAYVFIKVVEPCYNGNKVFTYTPDSSWAVVGSAGTCGASATETTTVYGYGSSAAMTELQASNSTSALFSSVVLNSNLDATAINALNQRTSIEIVLTAYAIQSDNLSSVVPTSVWANFTP